MTTYEWYSQLKKPSWSPPPGVFGPVWSVLYILIAISFGYVLLGVVRHKLPSATALPFVLNLVFNFLFTPLQFGLKSNVLAAIDILAVLITLVWAMSAIWPYHPWVALINIPYLLWVSFATVLQLSIVFLNR